MIVAGRVDSGNVVRWRIELDAFGVDHSRVRGSHRCGDQSFVWRCDCRLRVGAGVDAAVVSEAVVGSLLTVWEMLLIWSRRFAQ